MRLHVGNKHTGEEYVKRRAECGVCGKAFRCAADLRAHAVVHTREKPFKCKVCSAAFSQKATLKGGLRTLYLCRISAFGPFPLHSTAVKSV